MKMIGGAEGRITRVVDLRSRVAQASRMDSISYDSKPRGASPGVTPSTALSPMPGFGANGGGMPSLAANGSHAAGGRLSRAASAKTAIPRSSSATALRDEISTSRQAVSVRHLLAAPVISFTHSGLATSHTVSSPG